MVKTDLWDREVVEYLTTYYKTGLSASVLAEQLSNRFKRFYSRNAVIGKASRLGLIEASPRRTSLPRVRKPRAPTKGFSAQGGTLVLSASPLQPVELPTLRAPVCDPVSLVDLETHHCRWPVEGGYCGATKKAKEKGGRESPYCAFHHHHSTESYAKRQERAEKRKLQVQTGNNYPRY